jgi:hypothetical protein
MAINLSTIGVQLHYAVEATAGTRPTSGYTRIYGIKSTPSLNPAPDTIETTTLDELEYKTYVDGLKDLGGALEFTFNLTEELITAWDALITAYESGADEGKQTWFAIVVPGLTDAFYFPGNPSKMGLPETAVNSVLEITNYITPVGAPEKAAKPTAK